MGCLLWLSYKQDLITVTLSGTAQDIHELANLLELNKISFKVGQHERRLQPRDLGLGPFEYWK